MTKEQRERYLRQDIHALRVKKFNWTEDQLRQLIKHWGYGESLTALDELALTEIKLILMRVRIKEYPDEYTYDSQGMYMHSLMMRAGWNKTDLRSFLITHYRKSHWNLLSENERKAVIAMLQYYIDKKAQATAEADSQSASEPDKKVKSHKRKSNKEVSHGNEPRQDT
jgi:predicted Fe-S protein YdhL (DUF1289 family)